MLLTSLVTAQFISKTKCRRGGQLLHQGWISYNRTRNLSYSRAINLIRSRGFSLTTCTLSDGSSSSKEGTSSETIHAKNTDDKGGEEKRLRFLPRPLGVAEPPRTSKLSWEERKQKLLDYDEHLKERRHLMKELATKGYWTDMTRLSDFGGKMWIAAPALIKEGVSLYFPDIEGTTLHPRQTVHTTDLCKGHVSLIAILTTLISESHIQSFVGPAISSFDSNPKFRYVQINLQENPLKSMLVSMLLMRLKSHVPEKYHSSYMLSHQNMEYVREDLGLLNRHIGYVYLVDENVKVRWAGCGFARDEEHASLKACIGELLKRLQKNQCSMQKE